MWQWTREVAVAVAVATGGDVDGGGEGGEGGDRCGGSGGNLSSPTPTFMVGCSCRGTSSCLQSG